MESKGSVKLENYGEYGIIRLDDPPNNLLQSPEFIPLTQLREWIPQNHFKGIIIASAGRHFSAGASLDNLFSNDFQRRMNEEMTRGKELLSFIRDLDIPVFSAVKGVCFGGGLELALSAHIIVCDHKAMFAFPEVNQGIIPGLGGTTMITSKTGRSSALIALLGGDIINAEEAKLTGITDFITDNPEEYCIQLLKRMISGRSLKIINYVMTAIRNATTLPQQEALMEETRMFCELAAEEGRKRNQKQ